MQKTLKTSFYRHLVKLDKFKYPLVLTSEMIWGLLQRAVKYILTDENAEVPIAANASWAPKIAAGKITGKANRAQAICLKPNTPSLVYIAADSGDKLI